MYIIVGLCLTGMCFPVWEHPNVMFLDITDVIAFMQEFCYCWVWMMSYDIINRILAYFYIQVNLVLNKYNYHYGCLESD